MLNVPLIVFVLPLLLSSVIASASKQSREIDPQLARQYFAEADSACKTDNGKLWGHSLCGPMIFFDPATRSVIANQQDLEGRLKEQNGTYIGRLPDAVGAANTAIEWAGVRWSMINWGSLDGDRYERDRLMMHESFHRVQVELGFPLSNPSNNHLDSFEGRLWLQLEWRALAAALTRTGAEQRKAIRDALLFRSFRHQLFPRARSEEALLEMNEGLAEYTGVKLGGRSNAELLTYLAGRLGNANRKATFVRSFAYETGPAYGVLLDALQPDWRGKLKADSDLSEMLRLAVSFDQSMDVKSLATQAARTYDFDSLLATENVRANERKARLAGYRSLLIDGPVLIIPLSNEFNYSFDPNNLVAFEPLGTVYPTMKVIDSWGILTVSGGALMTRNEKQGAKLFVAAPDIVDGPELKGNGWTLKLNKGWKVETSERKGDFVLVRSKSR